MTPEQKHADAVAAVDAYTSEELAEVHFHEGLAAALGMDASNPLREVLIDSAERLAVIDTLSEAELDELIELDEKLGDRAISNAWLDERRHRLG